MELNINHIISVPNQTHFGNSKLVTLRLCLWVCYKLIIGLYQRMIRHCIIDILITIMLSCFVCIILALYYQEHLQSPKPFVVISLETKNRKIKKNVDMFTCSNL